MSHGKEDAENTSGLRNRVFDEASADAYLHKLCDRSDMIKGDVEKEYSEKKTSNRDLRSPIRAAWLFTFATLACSHIYSIYENNEINSVSNKKSVPFSPKIDSNCIKGATEEIPTKPRVLQLIMK